MPDNPRQPHAPRWDGDVRSLAAGREHTGRPPVVIVPGLGALGYLMDTLAGCAGWAPSFLLDLPGFGHRSPPPHAAELPAVVDAVAGWLDVVADRTPVVLVGHSTGAQAALHVAVRQPERVRALVLMGPTFPPEQRRLRGLVRGYVRNSRHEPVGLLPVTMPYYVRGGPRAVATMLRSAQRDRPEDTITGVGCPTLLVRGARDAFAPAPWLDRLAAAAPDGRLVTVPGAHTFPFRRGGLTAALIAETARRAGVLG